MCFDMTRVRAKIISTKMCWACIRRATKIVSDCVSFSVTEVLSPVGALVLVYTASLLPVGNLRSCSSSSSDETGELSGCWACVGWIGVSGAFWAPFEDLPPLRLDLLSVCSVAKLLAAANAKSASWNIVPSLEDADDDDIPYKRL